MKKVLFIGYLWPEPKTTAAGHRMMQLLGAFQEQNFEIVFATTASKTQYSEDLSSLGIQTEAIVLNDESFDVFVNKIAPDMVIFDRFMVEEQFGWRLAEAAPNALRILNTEDLHSLRNSRQLALKKGEEFTTTHWLENDLTKREVASIYRSDLTLLVSHFEKQLLKEALDVPEQLLYHLPFLLEEISGCSQEVFPAFEDRRDFICFGNGKHEPNVDAIRYLKQDIWPLIKKDLPEAQVHIYGAYLPQQVQELHQPKDRFLIKGWIADLDTVLEQTRINLAPLRFGAGIKGKLSQAMQNGTPSVTTSIGAEGMFAGLPIPVEIADTPEAFAQKAIALYTKKIDWTAKQEEGIETINQLYSKQQLIPAFFESLNSLYKGLAMHRKQNFIGALLQHQTMASTKYMSKWIEAKNKP
ncbi:glycosyltransferase family 4 protein [Croceitalea sp. P059]|uniref:glycosyltransferase family 4 protein n=1 Tax=Croceitalea sp. P059 TaxID=3075601 RepID=UPI0028882960|nr:glycosyltransferase family 4 protein [Croceitalea sp. P059]MDT0539679.1 glycosyltransferase family 4 protein [Croceitalea sp. P059]